MGLEITCKIVHIYFNVYFIGEMIYRFWAHEPKTLRSTVVRAFPFFCNGSAQSRLSPQKVILRRWRLTHSPSQRESIPKVPVSGHAMT